MASFVRDHLGPVLAEKHAEVKIIGFDHNKDHVATWAKALYADPDAAKYFAGVGVHWYGGLNTHNLNSTHHIAPDKIILATEACNCGGVVFRTPKIAPWWSRAESLALDILEDLKTWTVRCDLAGGDRFRRDLAGRDCVIRYASVRPCTGGMDRLEPTSRHLRRPESFEESMRREYHRRPAADRRDGVDPHQTGTRR